MLKELFRPGAPFPTNAQEGLVYTEELTDGIRIWKKINVVAVPLVILLWAVGAIPAILLGFVALFLVGCPIIMTLGYSIGCLRYLRVSECYEILKNHLAAHK
ncbi:MAG: hypothetical protein AAB461_01780 [Patescibacteria group bacterium]